MANDEDDSQILKTYQYEPINSYQTRLLELHGDAADANAPLTCTLFTADLLDPSFDGLGLRSKNIETDLLVSYDALSYTWGSEEKSREILCDHKSLCVTSNLFDALQALRNPGDKHRYLWVDAVCIDQQNKKEKAAQVRNMFLIYKKASRVIAWLGSAHESSALLLSLTPTSANTASEFDHICEALENLYTNPWFRRIWIQQEIFAARILNFQWGPLRFQWSALLSDPALLWEYTQLEPYHEVNHNTVPCVEQHQEHPPQSFQRRERTIAYLKSLHRDLLDCFESFRLPKFPHLDFIDTLVQTSSLNSTNPKDHIYGILGMTAFPAKPMSILEWIVERQSGSGYFLPVDYTANLDMINLALTWTALMKFGITLFIYIKPQGVKLHHANTQVCTSWVIDWQLVTKKLKRVPAPYPPFAGRFGDMNVWHDPLGAAFTNGGKFVEHEQFCKDNKGSTHAYTKLVLRGVIDSRFYFRDGWLWERCTPFHMAQKAWEVLTEILPTDLVVYMVAFASPCRYKSLDSYASGVYWKGVWLLRPAGNNEFRFITCLVRQSHIDRLHDQQLWDPEPEVTQLYVLPTSQGHQCPRLF